MEINSYKTDENANNSGSFKGCPTNNRSEAPDQASSRTQFCAPSNEQGKQPQVRVSMRPSRNQRRKLARARRRLAEAQQRNAESAQRSANFGSYSQTEDRRSTALLPAISSVTGSISTHACAKKRQRDDSPHRENYNPKRNKFWTDNDSTSAQVVDESLRCAVINWKWPVACLTLEHLEAFKAGVAREIHEIPYGAFVPRFHDSFLEDGAIVIECADSASRVWIKELMPQLYPRKNDPLKVVGLEEIRKLHRFLVWVPGPPEDTEVLLKLLERQNQGLLTDGWRVYVDQDVSCEGKTLVLDIDNVSIRYLQDVEFRPFLGAQRVTFHFPCTERTE